MASATVARGVPDRTIYQLHEDRGGAGLVAGALDAAMRVRAPGVQASTELVAKLGASLGRELGLDSDAQAMLEVAARVRDVGMLALPDSVVLATSALSPEDWELINRHPALGAELLEELSAVAAVAPIVRSHHERWDGSGYPDGRSGDAIPLLSQVIAVCDAFVAVATDRPHRRGMGAAAALELVRQESGSQFGPVMADALTAALARTPGPCPATAAELPPRDVATRRPGYKQGPADLTRTILGFDVVPVLAPAYERLLAATQSDDTTGAELVMAIESDVGLTVAVLRGARALGGRRPITNVPDAVVALSSAGVAAAVEGLPRAEFPWRTSPLQILMHRFLVHAQAVARAADLLARELDLAARDDVLVAALLHDLGKLVLGRADPRYSSADDVDTAPEDRTRREQHNWGMDHASIGGLLLQRWELPERLTDSVARHHEAATDGDVATYVRLADMFAHHAQGHVVDHNRFVSLARICGLSTNSVREILFDLPHSGASDRRRAERTPLSARQTDVLKLLSSGKHYKQIASELGVTVSTIRSHLHAVYATLGVNDRAQAVLRATEMGWI